MIGDPDRRAPAPGVPLRRVTDVVEDVVAWVLAAAVLAVVVASAVAGLSAYAQAAEQARAEAGERTAVTGTLLEAVPAVSPSSGYQLPVDADVRWTGRDGAPQTGVVPVEGPAPAGTPVTVWLDGTGHVVSPPVTEVEAVGAGVLTGLLMLGGGAVAVALGRDLARRAIDRANAARWEREWADVEPRWSGRR